MARRGAAAGREKEKGQGALEYVLLIGGAILLVIIVVSIIRLQVVQQTGNQTQTQAAGFFDFLNETKNQLISGNYSTPATPSGTGTPSTAAGFFLDTNETDFGHGTFANSSSTGAGASAGVALGGPLMLSGGTTTDPSIIAYWKFDDNAAYGEGSTRAYDYSGHGRNGTMAHATYVDGVFGKAIHFSNADTGDRVTASVGNTPDFEISNNFTVEAWVRLTPPASGQYYTIVAFPNDEPWFGVHNEGALVLKLYGISEIQDVAFPTGVWKHVVLTWDSVEGIANIYRDGRNQYTGGTPPAGSASAIAVTPSAIAIGQSFDYPTYNNYEGWEGEIDELAIYNRTLNASEVLANHEAEVPAVGSFERVFDALAPVTWQYFNWSTPTAYNQETTLSGMAGFWKFNGDAADASGNGNTAALQGGASYAAGKLGNALSLDGSSGYANVTYSAALDPTSAWTVEAWVKPSADSVQNAIVSKQYSWPTSGNYFLIINPDNLFYAYLLNGFTTPVPQCVSTTTFSAGNWYHVAATYDSAASSIKCYVNGQLEGSSTVSGGQPTAFSGEVRIGANGESSASLFFGGLIDSAAVYGRALSADEIRGRFEQGALNLTMQVAAGSSAGGPWSWNTPPYRANQSGGVWLSGLSGRYFAYRASFSRDNTTGLLTPRLDSVFANYTP